MKKTSLSLFILIVFLALTSFKPGGETKRVPMYGSKVEVIFSHHLSFDDLAKMKHDLIQKDIVLNFIALGFDENGKLTSIDFHVKCGSKYDGGAEKEDISNESHFGFLYNNSINAKVNFRAGEL